ncbi:MAG: NBR1-Ig-like domain-containing protein [Anaerolineales bacterium]|nr:NBR1-Ig-like domain-containing protein [Anaerolineales bacterium]
MLNPKKYLLSALLILTLTLTACGADGSTQESTIQTAVALTVAAQNTNQPASAETPSAPVIPTRTPYQLETPTLPSASLPTQQQGSNQKFECAKASILDETILDGTIFKPGEQFTKTWYITNTSACVWDSNYKIVFWSGNILGGGYVYNLPQVTGPGQTVPISLILTTPETDGTYRSEWKLQTPDGINFGVGAYSASFYTEVVVSSAVNPEYSITSVDLYVTRDPLYGCQPANITYTAYATITTNGPMEFEFRWLQQDGNNSGIQFIKVTSASQQTFTRVWKLGRTAGQNSNRWFQIVVLSPVNKSYPKVGFEFFCP